MNRRLYCVECAGEGNNVDATETVDDDPVCAMHGRVLAALSAGCAVRQLVRDDNPLRGTTSAVKRTDACTRGCGQPTHRGLCKGQQAKREYSGWSAPKVVKMREELPKPVPVLEAMRAANPGFEAAAGGGLEEIAAASGGSGMDVLSSEDVVEIPISKVPSGSTRNIGRLGALWLRLMATPFETALKVKCRDADHAGQTARHMTLKARKAGVAIFSGKVGSTYYCHRLKEEAKR